MTVEKLITDHIDIWSSALQTRSTAGRGSNGKIDLYGIKKLRELILELAVRGKLVPQDPNDEPASELLKRIAAEKTELVKQGKIKKQKPLPEISEDEKPFELPEGWEWVRLIELGTWALGSGFPASIQGNTNEDILMCKVSDMNLQGNEKYILSTNNTLSENTVLQKKINVSEPGTIIFPKIGGAIATNKRRILLKKTAIDNNCLGIKPFSLLSIDWFFIILNSIDMAKYQSGTSVPAINQSIIGNILVALPPSSIQIHIVKEVEQLMSLCDQLEQQSLTHLDAHQQLVETLLATLTDSKNAKELSENWSRISQHFDTLFTTEASIDSLKQTILQLAVMGKLVPQDPNDEPASELLKRIGQEKAQMVKNGKIKKQKPLPPISDEEKPFELPQGWEWCQLIEIAQVGTGATPSRDNPDYWRFPEYNWVTSGETSLPFIFNTAEKISIKAVNETNVSIYPPGTLIIAMYGQGKTRGQITELCISAGTNQACAAIQLFEPNEYHRRYIKLFFEKSYEDLRSLAAGGAQPNLNLAKVSNTLIPIPPLNEQIKITTKVNELFSICNILKSRLQSAQQTQLHLADALTEAALN